MKDAAPAARDRPRHVPALDGVRGLAVLAVFLYHYSGGTHSSFASMRVFGLLNKGGWAGVVLFFVLSGFLITGILWDGFGDTQWWRKFVARRTLRIFPLYYLVLAMVLAGAAIAGTARAALHDFWIPLLFLENMPHLNAVSNSIASPLPMFHLWSIAVEEQFYLLWPWLLVPFARERTPAAREGAKVMCLAVFTLSLALRVYLWTRAEDPGMYEHFLPVQAGALALGGYLALAYRGAEWAGLRPLATMCAVAGLTVFLAAGVLSHDFNTSGRYMMTYGLTAITLFFAALLYGAVGTGTVSRMLRAGWLRWLGNYSYGIYVYHVMLRKPAVLIVAMAGAHGAMAQNAGQFAVAAMLSLGCAWLSYHLFEKQFLRLKRYFVPDVAR